MVFWNFIIEVIKMDLATRARVNSFKNVDMPYFELKRIYKFCVAEYRNLWRYKKSNVCDKAHSDTMDYYKEIAKITKKRLKNMEVA